LQGAREGHRVGKVTLKKLLISDSDDYFTTVLRGFELSVLKAMLNSYY
jgi:hypothetical protein